MNASVSSPLAGSNRKNEIGYALFAFSDNSADFAGIIPIDKTVSATHKFDTVSASSCLSLTSWKCNSFDADGNIIVFKTPLSLSIYSTNDEYYTIIFKPLGIEVTGSDIESAKSEFYDELRYCYFEYALCSEEQMLKVAKEYRRWFLNNI